MKQRVKSDKGCAARRGEQGFSMIQMVVTVAIIAIVISFGVMSITRAQKDMALAGTMRELTVYLEKGRIEAVRRHTTVNVINITSATQYTVTLDSNYDGTLSATETRTITLPSGMTFNTANLTFPATISYDSRGRSSSTNITGSSVAMTNSYGASTNLTMTGGGDVTLDSTVTGPAANTNITPVTSISNTANVRSLN